MAGVATLEEFIAAICEHPRWHWAARWFRLGEVVVHAPSICNDTHTMSFRNPDARCPVDVEALGCTGRSSTGHASWFGFDLDVGHGGAKQRYATTDEAIAEARRIRDALDGRAEIRLSKSGVGVHVRSHMPEDPKMPMPEAVRVVKDIAEALALKCDRTVLGRQAFWLWCRNPNVDSFKLIEEHANG
jgi:hypothetical protein